MGYIRNILRFFQRSYSIYSRMVVCGLLGPHVWLSVVVALSGFQCLGQLGSALQRFANCRTPNTNGLNRARYFRSIKVSATTASIP